MAKRLKPLGKRIQRNGGAEVEEFLVNRVGSRVEAAVDWLDAKATGVLAALFPCFRVTRRERQAHALADVSAPASANAPSSG